MKKCIPCLLPFLLCISGLAQGIDPSHKVPVPHFEYLGLGEYFTEDLDIVDNYMYAATDDGVFKKSVYDLSSSHWTSIGLKGMKVLSLLVLDPTTIFAVVNAYHSPENELIYKTEDGGKTWNAVFYDFPLTPLSPPKHILDRHPGSYDVFYLVNDIQDGIFKSDNGGFEWERIAGQSQFNLNRFLKVNPYSPNQLWYGGEGLGYSANLFESLDFGVTWHEKDTGGLLPFESCFHNLVIDDHDPQTWYLPGEYGVLKTEDNGDSFSLVLEDLVYFLDVGINPASSQILYASGITLTVPVELHHLYRSNDGGETWWIVDFEPLYPKIWDSKFARIGFLEIPNIYNQVLVVLAGNTGVYLYYEL